MSLETGQTPATEDGTGTGSGGGVRWRTVAVVLMLSLFVGGLLAMLRGVLLAQSRPPDGGHVSFFVGSGLVGAAVVGVVALLLRWGATRGRRRHLSD